MGYAGAALAGPVADVSLSADLVVWTPSDYAETLRVFDRVPPSVGFQVAARGARLVRPWLAIGGRLGWAMASAEVDAQSAMGTDNPAAPMQFHLFDAGALVRVLYAGGQRERGGLRLHTDLEAGAVLGNVSTGGVTQRWVRPRVDLSLFVGWQGRSPDLYVGARFGYQYVPWDGAGGSAFDPAFSGFHVGVEGGISP